MLSWLANYRTDIYCSINRSAQVKNDTMRAENIFEFNKAIKLENNLASALQYGKIENIACNEVLFRRCVCIQWRPLTSSRIIILICDTSERAHILEYYSKKSKHTVRLIMGDDVYAFADVFDLSLSYERVLNLCWVSRSRFLCLRIQINCLIP